MSDKQAKKEINLSAAGIYFYGLGRRKTATVRARLYFDAPKDFKGAFLVNERSSEEYFSTKEQQQNISRPLEAAGINKKDVFISIKAEGGGKTGQAEAARLAVSRALIVKDENLKPILKALGFLTRDSRKRERKKPGLRRARRAPQWVKR